MGYKEFSTTIFRVYQWVVMNNKVGILCKCFKSVRAVFFSVSSQTGIRWMRYNNNENSQQHGGIKMSLSIIYLIMENILHEPSCALDTHTHKHIKIAICICPCTLKSRSLALVCCWSFATAVIPLRNCMLCVHNWKLNYEITDEYISHMQPIRCLIVHVVYALYR